MKYIFTFILLICCCSYIHAQPDEQAEGKNTLLVQPDGTRYYISAISGVFHSLRIFASTNEEDRDYKGTRLSDYIFPKITSLYKGEALASAFTSDSGLIMAGKAFDKSRTGSSAVVVKLTATGAIDSQFHSGFVAVPQGESDEFNNVLALADGRIIVAGIYTAHGVIYPFILRMTQEGELDKAFGNNGICQENINGFNNVVGIAIQPDGKIILAGNIYTGGDCYGVLARYNEDGNKDASFAAHGILSVANAFPGNFRAKQLRIQPDGKILLAGELSNSNGGRNIELIRYNADGSADKSFGSEGAIQTVATFEDRVDDIALYADGRILLAGAGSLEGEMKNCRYIMLRYSATGEQEKTFGYGAPSGMPTYIMRPGFYVFSNNIVIKDNKIFGNSQVVSQEPDRYVYMTIGHEILSDTLVGTIDNPDTKLNDVLGYNLYPNPVISNATFSFELDEKETINIKLLDMAGQEVSRITENEPFEKGTHNISFSFPSFCAAGSYLLVFTTNAGHKVVVKIIKL